LRDAKIEQHGPSYVVGGAGQHSTTRHMGYRFSWKIASCSVYAATLVDLYLVSSLYHSARGATKDILRKVDHCAIYLLIAGTYTPFTLVTLRGTWGWSMFAVVWVLALLGLVQEI
jgi:hemolysin III